MKTFKNKDGLEWIVDVNVTSIKRVRDLANFDLLKISEGESGTIETLVGDPITLVNVIYVLCKPQADERNISDEAFGQQMGGDAIDDATTALLEELVFFYPSRRRAPMTKALAKLKQIEARQIELAIKMLDDPKLDARIETALLELGGTKSDPSLQSAA